MPLYDYICINEKCEQKEFSVLKTGFEDTWEYCPECKEKSNKRKNFTNLASLCNIYICRVMEIINYCVIKGLRIWLFNF